MKKYIIAIMSSVLVLGACTKDITKLNVDPKNPQNVPAITLFTGAQRTFINLLSNTSVNENNFRLVTQQWQETSYLDESRYNFIPRNVADGLWNPLYRTLLNLEFAKGSLATDPLFPADDLQSAQAVVDLTQIQIWYYLVTTFGNIPYTEALNADNTLPKYDDAITIYKDLLKRLDADIVKLAKGNSIGAADLVYSGDIAKWKKFANSIKLKMAMTIADADAALSKAAAESAFASGVFTASGDNAYYPYETSPPNTNPIWLDLVQGGRHDFVGCSTYIDALKGFGDPRLALYFDQDKDKGYTGGKPGEKSTFSELSIPIIAKFNLPNFRGEFMSYSEVSFLLAEAAARNYNVGATATEHYNNAITASILDWGGNEAQATAYLLNPKVAYATATGNWKQKIGTQKWFAMFNKGWDSWVDIRVLDFPKLPKPTGAISDFPTRLTYPLKEQNANKTNVQTAISAIGGNLVTTKLFFDKF